MTDFVFAIDLDQDQLDVYVQLVAAGVLAWRRGDRGAA
jgi:hypothetical protein